MEFYINYFAIYITINLDSLLNLNLVHMFWQQAYSNLQMICETTLRCTLSERNFSKKLINCIYAHKSNIFDLLRLWLLPIIRS